jgi:uncharacterized protein (TIGR00266 family)
VQTQPAYPSTPQAPLGGGTGSGIPHQVTHGPSFAMLRVDLPPGRTLVSEAGAMVARSNQVAMEVKMNASPSAGFFDKLFAILVALVRKVVGGETFFVNHWTTQSGGSIWLAPTMSGPIAHRIITPGTKLVLSSGAYLASSGNIDVKMKFGGLKSLLAKEGAFMLEISGEGELWYTSYGGIHPIDVNGSYVVDNGHLVGYEGNLTMNIKSAGGGLLGFMASGEGMVCEFRGQGRIYIQSRNESALVEWLTRLLP